MSIEAMNWVMAQDNFCESGSESAILFVIASWAGVDGTCYPSQETIARKASVSTKTVERTLQAFEARGWITRTVRRRKDGSRTSDLITFLAHVSPEKPEPEHQPDTVSGSGAPTRQPVQSHPTSCPDQPDTVSGLTTFEPLGDSLGDSLSGAGAPERQTEAQATGRKVTLTHSLPNAEYIAWAVRRALERGRDLDAAAEAERFANHARDSGRRSADWFAAWRNWIDLALDKSPATPPDPLDPRPPKGAVPSSLFDLVAPEKGDEFAYKWLNGARVVGNVIYAPSMTAINNLCAVRALANYELRKRE